MGKTKRKGRKRAQTKPSKPASRPDHRPRAARKGLGVAIAALVVALVAVGVALGSREERDGSVHETAGDVVYVNNEKCAMSGSTIVEEDLGRFESRVMYDGPLEQFRGKTLVFNQCCPKCIEDFPAKWAAERDDIMREFGLGEPPPEGDRAL